MTDMSLLFSGISKLVFYSVYLTILLILTGFCFSFHLLDVCSKMKKIWNAQWSDRVTKPLDHSFTLKVVWTF